MVRSSKFTLPPLPSILRPTPSTCPPRQPAHPANLPTVPFLTNSPALKICGVTRTDDAVRLADLGVEAIGVNFWPGSKRFTDPADVVWLANLAGRICRVGVFVNADPALPVRLFRDGLIDMAQLHGEETPADTAPLAAAGLPIIKATGVATVADLERALTFHPVAVLADAPAPAGTYGGTGRVLDWTIARAFVAAGHPVPLILAGGITPENAAAAIETVRPAALDVASGSESSPGVKDFTKVAALLHAVRAAR